MVAEGRAGYRGSRRALGHGGKHPLHSILSVPFTLQDYML
jgi:hypothetical protein